MIWKKMNGERRTVTVTIFLRGSLASEMKEYYSKKLNFPKNRPFKTAVGLRN